MLAREPLSFRYNDTAARPESDPIADHPRIDIGRRQSMEGSMGTMTDFWAREWLLEDIALRHAINDLDTAIQIGQQAGLLTSDAYLTDVGRRYVKDNRANEVVVALEH
jgi:hypothetical protein